MTKREKEEVLVPMTDAEAGAIQAVSEVERLKRALRDLREVAFDGPSEAKGSGCREGYSEWRDRIDRETKALLDGTTPAGRVFTEAEVREVLDGILAAAKRNAQKAPAERTALLVGSVEATVVNAKRRLALD